MSTLVSTAAGCPEVCVVLGSAEAMTRSAEETIAQEEKDTMVCYCRCTCVCVGVNKGVSMPILSVGTPKKGQTASGDRNSAKSLLSPVVSSSSDDDQVNDTVTAKLTTTCLDPQCSMREGGKKLQSVMKTQQVMGGGRCRSRERASIRIVFAGRQHT